MVARRGFCGIAHISDGSGCATILSIFLHRPLLY
jgi:hypothetical protein